MYRLVKISPIGRQSDVAMDFAPDSLIEAGTQLQHRSPSDKFGVIDKHGFYVWPPHLATSRIGPDVFDPIVKQEYIQD